MRRQTQRRYCFLRLDQVWCRFPVVYVVVVVYVNEFLIDIIIVVCRLVHVCNVAPIVVDRF